MAGGSECSKLTQVPLPVSGSPADHSLAALLLLPQPQQWSPQGPLSPRPETDSRFPNWVPQSLDVLPARLGSAQSVDGKTEGGRAFLLKPQSV